MPDGAIRVRVVDEDGTGIAGVRLALRSMDRERDAPTQGKLLLTTDWRPSMARTNERGVALLFDLEEGAWRVAAGLLPQWAYQFSEPVEQEQETTIVLTRLPEDRVLSGVVLSPEGQLIRGAYVRFIWNDRGSKGDLHTMTDAGGRFTLLARATGLVGVLHANVYRNRYRSRAMDPVAVGTKGIVLRLGEPRSFELDCRDQFGKAIDKVTVSFSWHLAGFAHKYQGGGMQESGMPPRWEIPDVPFYVNVSRFGYRSVQLGPLDPSSVGEKLLVTLQAYPRLRGRVVHRGTPVPKASIRIEGFGPPPASQSAEDGAPSAWKLSTRADSEGNFDVALTRGGEVTIRTVCPGVGEGELGPIDLDLESLPTQLEVEVTRELGSIRGQVLFPPGRGPGDIYLSTTKGHGYMPVQSDGSFFLPDLPSGPLVVRVYRAPGGDDASGPISTSIARDSDQGWIWMSHGPTRAPDWLTVEPTFDALIRSGESTVLELDLGARAACRLIGQLLIDGEPPPVQERGPWLYLEPTPGLVLDRGEGKMFVSRTEFAVDGTFELWANQPGTYRIRLNVATSSDQHWTVIDQVSLERGVTPWAHDIETGGLTILPRDIDGVQTPFHGEVRWQGPKDLSISLRFVQADKETRKVVCPVVPIGAVQLIEYPPGRPDVFLLDTHVRVGKTTTVRIP